MRKGPSSSCLTSLFAAYNRPQTHFLLPILYLTRTLSNPARHFHAASSHVDNHDRRSRTFCSSSQAWAHADRARRSDNDRINFIDPYYSQTPDALSPIEAQRQTKPVRPSTVTKSEKAVFDRLINNVSQQPTQEPDGEDILDHDEQISGYDPNTDLDTIFEDAIKQLRMQEELAAKRATKNLLDGPVWPRTLAIGNLIADKEETLSARLFTRPLKFANGTTLGNDIKDDEERMRLEVACDDHRYMVMSMLDSASSDVEIWKVLEKEVFSLITHLDEYIKQVEKSTKLHAAKVRKAEAEGIDIADVKLEKGDLMKKVPSVNLTQTKAIPINNLLSILHRNYAEYCLYALRLFRRNHPLSPYGPQVLSTIKRRGPISYVLGVSTDIYNEALFLQWTQYSSLHGMADTIEEMLNQGIEGNEVTIALIKGIAQQRRMGRREVLGPVLKAWWYMRGVVEGWTRVVTLHARIVRELSESAAMATDEAESDEGELDTEKE